MGTRRHIRHVTSCNLSPDRHNPVRSLFPGAEMKQIIALLMFGGLAVFVCVAGTVLTMWAGKISDSGRERITHAPCRGDGCPGCDWKGWFYRTDSTILVPGKSKTGAN